MCIAVSSRGPTLDSEVDERFGRCPCFILVDTSSLKFQILDNSSQSEGGGAGVASAQLIAGSGVEAVLTGNCGPNAFRVLTTGGTKVFTGVSGTVREAIERYRSGKYAATGGASVSEHFGIAAPESSNKGRTG
jgi:predicted Fe-Mo cluster-binding NifX family protein